MKRLLVGFLLLTACSGLPWQREPAAGPAWQVVQQGEVLKGPMLAAWGTDGNNILFVGGTVGNGGEALVYRYDGSKLTLLHPGGTHTLWWVHGLSMQDVWMVGEHGRITHFDGTTFRDETPVVDTTLWGVIAFSPSDVWAVGGMPGRPNGSPNDVVLHFDGTSWTQQALPGTPRNVALLKAWGTSGDNLYVVGEQATLWHHTSSGWVMDLAGITPPLADGTLFSVNGCSASEVYAGGGNRVLKSDGTHWERLDVGSVSVVNGLNCGKNGLTVVGFSGLKLRVQNGAVQNDTTQEPSMNLHAAWSDPDGNVWVVGGDWVSQSQNGFVREGLIGRYGAGHVTADLVQ